MATPLISVARAREQVLELTPSPRAERVPIDAALDRMLLEPVSAAGPSPPFDCSAMDGYAVRAGEAGRVVEVIAEAQAGHPSPQAVVDGQAARISTGAPVPAGAEAVIRQEDVRVLEGGRVELLCPTSVGGNIRRAGEDMRAGTLLLQPGAVLGPAELAVAVGAGAGSLVVASRPRVAIVCTGDELQPPGAPLAPGQIHNSNGPMLAALSARCGGAPQGPVRLPDARAATEAALARAVEDAELVVISGGVSVGPHDHVKPALKTLGVEERFWGVALQPGKPTWFGFRGRTLVFGLPGNPVSTAVTFSLFVAPALAAMLGAGPLPPLGRARLAERVRRNPQRLQALRVRLGRDGDGLLATPTGPQGSHIISSLLGAQALAMIPPGEGELPAGAPVEIERLLL